MLFDDERAVANAGVLLPATLADRLGIEALVDRIVDLGDRAGAANPGRKLMTLVSAMALGADCIDDCDVLRSGQTPAVLGHRVSAPSTLGTFLRAFTFGHVRQLDKVLADCLARAWAAGAGPGDDRLVVDVDSFVGEVYGYDKQGAGYGYTHKRGYHPIVATRSQTGEVVHIRARKGSANTSRGALRFVEELIPRVARAGATGPRLLRTDSGFWNTKIMARLERAGWTYSIGITQQKHIKTAITAIPEQDWQTLEDYPDGGEAQIAQTMLGRQRLIVRRTRLIGPQAELWPDWRYFAFLTNRVDALELVESEHRQHAVVELAIRDLKDQALAHSSLTTPLSGEQPCWSRAVAWLQLSDSSSAAPSARASISSLLWSVSDGPSSRCSSSPRCALRTDVRDVRGGRPARGMGRRLAARRRVADRSGPGVLLERFGPVA